MGREPRQVREVVAYRHGPLSHRGFRRGLTANDILCCCLTSACRYDIAWYLADYYKKIAKILLILQLLLAWVIVVLSTLYASWNGRNETSSADDGLDEWWMVRDNTAINAVDEIVFSLTIAAAFLISFESYINAKAR